jgi:hypothetical protein
MKIYEKFVKLRTGLKNAYLVSMVNVPNSMSYRNMLEKAKLLTKTNSYNKVMIAINKKIANQHTPSADRTIGTTPAKHEMFPAMPGYWS